MEAWTAQYRYTGPYRLDVTVKGQDPFGKLFAPTWDMVNLSKKQPWNDVTKRIYVEKYHELILNVINKNPEAWKKLIAMPYVVLVCFCPAGEFCHRHLLMHYLTQYGAVCHGEITDFSRWSKERKVINDFKGQYAWLSNFAPCKFTHEDIEYDSTETFYQAMKFGPDDMLKIKVDNKFIEVNAREYVAKLPAGKAKRMGKKAKLPWNWDTLRVDVMELALNYKYSQPYYVSLLRRTDDALLIEGNYWHDNFWGDCSCPKCEHIKGANTLGQLTMRKRDALQKV